MSYMFFFVDTLTIHSFKKADQAGIFFPSQKILVLCFNGSAF